MPKCLLPWILYNIFNEKKYIFAEFSSDMFRGFLRASLLPPKRLKKESETPFVDQMVEESEI